MHAIISPRPIDPKLKKAKEAQEAKSSQEPQNA